MWILKILETCEWKGMRLLKLCSLWSKIGSLRTKSNSSLAMLMRCCFWSKLSNFGTNFAATRLMPKLLVKIEWHEPIYMFRSSANSLTMIRRLVNTIFFTSSMFFFCCWRTLASGMLLVVHIFSAFWEHFVPPTNVALVQGNFTVSDGQHWECVHAHNFVFHTKLYTDSLIHFLEYVKIDDDPRHVQSK